MTEANPTTERQSMDPELKAKWMEALRSGKYAQGTGQLRDGGDCFCCLGVLCDLVNPKAWDDDEWIYGEGEDEEREVGNLPFRFRLKTGLSDPAEGKLIRMNDDGLPFSYIADWIEKHL